MNTVVTRVEKIPKQNDRILGSFTCLCISPVLLCLNNVFLQLTVVNRCVLIANFLLIFLLSINNKVLTKDFWICCIGFLLALFNTAFNGSGFGSVITYASVLFFINFYSKINLSKTQLSVIRRISIFSLLVVLVFFSNQNATNTYYYSILPNLTIERLNPNTIGIYYFFLYILVNLELNKVKNKKLKTFLKLFLFAAVFYLILKTHARTTTVSFILYVLLNLLHNQRTYKVRYSNFFLYCLIGSLAFVFLYCLLSEQLGSIQFMGKNLFSGRQIVWSEALDIIGHNFIFGYNNGYAFLNGQILSAHNTLLAVLFIFGFVPTVIFVYLLDNSFKRLLKKNYDFSIIAAIFCCIIIMTFETLLTDANTFYYFTLLFLGSGLKSKEIQK